jgi:hypothetical protein
MKHIAPEVEREARAILARHQAGTTADVLRRSQGLPHLQQVLEETKDLGPEAVAAGRMLSNVFRDASRRPIVDGKPILSALEKVSEVVAAQVHERFGSFLPGETLTRRLGSEIVDVARRSTGQRRARPLTPARRAAVPIVAAAEQLSMGPGLVRSAAAATVERGQIDAADPEASIFRAVSVAVAPVLDAENDVQAAVLRLANVSGLKFTPTLNEEAVRELLEFAMEMSHVEMQTVRADVGMELIRHADVLAPRNPRLEVDLSDPHALAAAALLIGERYVSDISSWRDQRDHPNPNIDVSGHPTPDERPDLNPWYELRKPASSDWRAIGVRMDEQATAHLSSAPIQQPGLR